MLPKVNGVDVMLFHDTLSATKPLPLLDPVLVAEINETSLYDALTIAGLADRVIIVTELLQRGIPA